MENKMAEVAKLLGIELGEEFRLKDANGINNSCKFKLTIEGLQYKWKNSSKWDSSGLLEDFITGHYQISKEKTKPVLDDAEQRYLTNIIKPFRKHIITIRKIQNYKYEFIEIVIYRTDEGASCEVISFPYFNKGEMYKGMEINKEYTLEQLEL